MGFMGAREVSRKLPNAEDAEQAQRTQKKTPVDWIQEIPSANSALALRPLRLGARLFQVLAPARSPRRAHTARFSSSVDAPQATTSSIVRRHPSQNPLCGSMRQTLLQGDGT